MSRTAGVSENLTLAQWAAKVWMDFRRGANLVGQNAEIAYFMNLHREWHRYWDGLVTMKEGDEAPAEVLRHVFNDAAVKMQIDAGEPPEIRMLFDRMRDQKFTELESIHALGLALIEETERLKAGGVFDQARYIENARSFANETLRRPDHVRQTKSKVY